MNNMTEKLVKDGREGRRTQMHLTITIIGSFLMVLGLVCFLIKANSVEYIDANGILHENLPAPSRLLAGLYRSCCLAPIRTSPAPL